MKQVQEADGEYTPRPKWWFTALFLVLVASVIPFFPAMTGTPVWDDFDILRGPSIGLSKGWIGALTEPFNFGYFRPLVSLSFQIDHALFNASPFYFHQTNLVIHVLTVLCVVGFTEQVIRSPWWSLAGGLIFGVQPIQVSTVSWIGGRTDSLCALFLAAFAYTLLHGLRFLRGRSLFLGASCLAFFCSLLTKEQAAAALVVVPIAYALVVPKVDRNRRLGYGLGLAFGFAIFLFALFFLGSGITFLAAEKRSLIEQLVMGGRGLWHYALLMFVPTQAGLHTFTLEPSRAAGTWPIFAGYGVLLFAIASVFRLFKARSAACLALLLIIVAILPISNVIPVPSLLVGPYRAGIAGVGLAVLMAWLLFRVSQRSRLSGVAALAIIAAWHGAVSYRASESWRSEERFFATVIRHDPAFYVASMNVAASLDTTDEAAERHVTAFLDWLFQRGDWKSPESARRLWDSDPRIEQRIKDNAGAKVPTDTFLANAFLNLGLSQLRKGDMSSGIRSLLTATEFNPQDANIECGLGEAYVALGDPEAAEARFERAILIDGQHTPAHLGVASLLERQGRYDEAERHLRDAILGLPWHALASIRLARLYVKTGRPERAVQAIEAAVARGAMTRRAADDLVRDLRLDTRPP